MLFEWDEAKSRANLDKHGVSFEEAQSVFNDPLHIALLDHRFSYFEERWITLGNSDLGRLLVVANLFFNEDGEEVIRIISARRATARERQYYEDT
ncbi:MAG: BrnT family toxin [Natronospirillum sp.]|uniref:BrnT family toxin n=1 Tax=Natronospirillum sp. TaxID=2812955 RepID=UPI0025CD15F1|nr:BrnT family toxin [Natronospirillum sp.]MCH8552916.1 BrnT family toxin [Natronospirillum sp.]